MSEDIGSTGRSVPTKEEVKEKAEEALKTGKAVASGVKAWWMNQDSSKKKKYCIAGIIVIAIIVGIIVLCCAGGDPIEGKWEKSMSSSLLSGSITMDFHRNGTVTTVTTLGSKSKTVETTWEKTGDLTYKVGSGTAKLSEDGTKLKCGSNTFTRA